MSCPSALKALSGPKVLAKNSTGLPSTADPNDGEARGVVTGHRTDDGPSPRGLHLGRIVLPVAAYIVDGGAAPAGTVGDAGRGIERRARAGRGVVADELKAIGWIAHQPGDLLVAVPVGIGDAQCLRLSRCPARLDDEPVPAQSGGHGGASSRVLPGDRRRGAAERAALLLHDELGVGAGGRRDRGGVQAGGE